MEEENSCNGFNLIFQISIIVPKFWDLRFLLQLLKVSDIFIIIYIYFRLANNGKREVGFKLKKYDTIKDVITIRLLFEPIKSQLLLCLIYHFYMLQATTALDDFGNNLK